MERATEEPDALAQLFRLDHLTTRMRRQAEGLIILSGAAPGRTWRQPVAVVEVLRGAIGEIEDFARVELVTDSPDFVQGTAVADVTHMLAELIENAVQYSPPGTRVQVRGGRVANGYVIEIEDRGLGIPLDTMSTLNERLAKPPEFDLADSDQLGLFVVSRLAARHSVKISLRVSGYGGTSAVVLLPQDAGRGRGRGPLPGREGREGGASGPRRRRPSASASAAASSGASVGAAAEALAGRRMLRPERGLGVGAAAGGASPRRCRRAVRAGGTADSGPAGLPRRAPQTNMAPQLREQPPDRAHRDRWRAAHPSRPVRSCPLSSRDCGAAAPPVHLMRPIPRPTAKAPAPDLAGVNDERRTFLGRAGLAARQPCLVGSRRADRGHPLSRRPARSAGHRELSESDGGHLAALAAGAASLARGVGMWSGYGDVSQTIVEMEAALLFITPAGRGTCLALLAEAGADAGQIAYEMAVLVKRVGQHMIANPRFPVQDPVSR